MPGGAEKGPLPRSRRPKGSRGSAAGLPEAGAERSESSSSMSSSSSYSTSSSSLSSSSSASTLPLSPPTASASSASASGHDSSTKRVSSRPMDEEFDDSRDSEDGKDKDSDSHTTTFATTTTQRDSSARGRDSVTTGHRGRKKRWAWLRPPATQPNTRIGRFVDWFFGLFPGHPRGTVLRVPAETAAEGSMEGSVTTADPRMVAGPGLSAEGKQQREDNLDMLLGTKAERSDRPSGSRLSIDHIGSVPSAQMLASIERGEVSQIWQEESEAEKQYASAQERALSLPTYTGSFVSLPGDFATTSAAHVEPKNKATHLWKYWDKILRWFEGPYEDVPERTTFSQIGFPGIDPRAWPPDHLPFSQMLLLWLPFSKYGFHMATLNLHLHALAFGVTTFFLYWFWLSPTASVWEIISFEMGTPETRGWYFYDLPKWPVLVQISFSSLYMLASIFYHWYNMYSDYMWMLTMHVMTVIGAMAGVLLELPYLEYSFCNSATRRYIQYAVYSAFIVIGYLVVRSRRWLRPEAYTERTLVFLIVGLAILLMKTTVNIIWLGNEIWGVIWRSVVIFLFRCSGAWVNGTRFPETFTNRKWSSYVFTSSHLLVVGSGVAFALDFANSVRLLEFAADNCLEEPISPP